MSHLMINFIIVCIFIILFLELNQMILKMGAVVKILREESNKQLKLIERLMSELKTIGGDKNG